MDGKHYFAYITKLEEIAAYVVISVTKTNAS